MRKTNSLESSLFYRTKKRLQQQNDQSKRIEIRDIMLKDPLRKKEMNFTQLCRFIKVIFTLANEDHHLNACIFDKQHGYQLKPNFENYITRLSTTEFMFYIVDGPLTMVQFQMIIKQVETIAAQTAPNVHLVLSSFCVESGNQIILTECIKKEILNLCLYVECGPMPVIHCFSKNTAATGDISYKPSYFFTVGEEHFESLLAREKALSNEIHIKSQLRLFKKASPSACDSQKKLLEIHQNFNRFHHNFIAGNALNVNTGNVFVLETLGGAKWIQIVEICLDHTLGHGAVLLQNLLESQELHACIPEYVNHLVTSNRVEIYNANCVCEPTEVKHVEPIRSLQRMDSCIINVGDAWNTNRLSKKMSLQLLNRVEKIFENISSETVDFKITLFSKETHDGDQEGKYEVRLPDASKLIVECCEPRKLPLLKANYLTTAREHNRGLMSNPSS